jgi:hypothetical protein
MKSQQKESEFLKRHAQKLAATFAQFLDAESPEDESNALGKLQALRSTLRDIEILSQVNFVHKINVILGKESK